ncbi:MAG: hypothetical protein A2V77_14965 [Anaeromyxobacter sp. RBG_16_69_14]|nr:MAG: hypothetical protein A2V77_14965 [Anaeromyxobacter sp. RBG_16_69_14]
MSEPLRLMLLVHLDRVSLDRRISGASWARDVGLCDLGAPGAANCLQRWISLLRKLTRMRGKPVVEK